MSKEQALEILQGTRKLLEDPKRWTGGSWAKDDQGNTCNVNDPHAVCWCLQGAMRKVFYDKTVSGYLMAVNSLREPCLTTVNDNLHIRGDHAGLLKLIDNGIARLSGKRLRLS